MSSPPTRITAPETVQKVIVTHTDRDFTTLTLDATPVRGPPHTGKHQPQTLTTTWHHPFWDTGHHRWTDAHNLTPGTELRRPDGTTVTVHAVHNFHQHKTTYDLTVGTLHTYYVPAGTTVVLVHNCGDAVDAVNAEADRVADLTKSQRPNAIEALQIGDRESIVAHSDGGRGGRPVHPDVQAVLDSIPTVERGNNHGGCGLVECLTQALNAGQDPTGASAAAVMGRARANGNFQNPIGPCPS